MSYRTDLAIVDHAYVEADERGYGQLVVGLHTVNAAFDLIVDGVQMRAMAKAQRMIYPEAKNFVDLRCFVRHLDGHGVRFLGWYVPPTKETA